VGYERGEKFDLSALGVTMANVHIGSGSIVVDLGGAEDLTILVNTGGITARDFIFGG
jgi:hypothetical protein